MKVQLRSEQIAGLLSLLAALLAGVAWYIYVAGPSDAPLSESAKSQLTSTFAHENADRWWFFWFAALPVLLCVVGAAYLTQWSRNQAVAIVLVAVLIVLATSSFLLTTWALALFVALPIFWGWRCVRGA